MGGGGGKAEEDGRSEQSWGGMWARVGDGLSCGVAGGSQGLCRCGQGRNSLVWGWLEEF